MQSNTIRPVFFKNDGEIDPLSLTTMGASVKSNDSPIGYFGTGLKFAIATIMRMGGKVEIYIGEEKYEVETVKTLIRGEEFDLVHIDGVQAGYTTQLGRDWEPWMAYRELHSNTLDELNHEIDHGPAPEPQAGQTQIRVWHNDIQQEFYKRHNTFIESEPLFTVGSVEFHAGSNDRFIYYRGVKVGRFNRPTLFRYNITSGLTLTEDRTVKDPMYAELEVRRAIQNLKDVEIIKEIMKCGKEYTEYHMGYGSQTWDKSEEYLQAAREIMHDVTVDKSKLGEDTKLLFKTLRKSDVESMHQIDLDDQMAEMFMAAKNKIKATGCPVDEHETIIVETMGAGVMGLAKNGKAYIARAAFQNGQRYLTATLLEEWMQLTSGHADYSRGMQDWLFAEILATHDRAIGKKPDYYVPEGKPEDEIQF